MGQDKAHKATVALAILESILALFLAGVPIWYFTSRYRPPKLTWENRQILQRARKAAAVYIALRLCCFDKEGEGAAGGIEAGDLAPFLSMQDLARAYDPIPSAGKGTFPLDEYEIYTEAVAISHASITDRIVVAEKAVAGDGMRLAVFEDGTICALTQRGPLAGKSISDVGAGARRVVPAKGVDGFLVSEKELSPPNAPMAPHSL